MAEMTAAEKYAALKEDRFEAFINASFSSDSLKGVQLFEVKGESGMVFKCRKLDTAFLANTGSMPMALSEQLIAQTATDAEGLQERFEAMSAIEKRATIQATAQMVRYICVSPRLVLGEVTNQTDAISTDALTMGDFKTLAEWAKNGGGGEAEGLKTFRKRRK